VSSIDTCRRTRGLGIGLERVLLEHGGKVAGPAVPPHGTPSRAVSRFGKAHQVQTFTVDQARTDASECDDGNACNGYEVCEFDADDGADICQPGAPVTCSGVGGGKLIIVDHVGIGGKAKTVFQSKDPGVNKTPGTTSR
jgi:hypothetical protein